MDSLTKARKLLNIDFWVFPVVLTADSQKVPAVSRKDGGRGHLDASNDPAQIEEWFGEKFPDALVGVHAGRSGTVLLDRDLKHDNDGEVSKDGFESVQDAWLVVPETFKYPSVGGLGQHDVYLAPENVVLNGVGDYRGLPGVDRRAGSSWWLWATDEVPDSRDAFAPAPEWLCDPAMKDNLHGFQGSVEEWFDSLIPGEPNLLVREAMGRIPADFSHSEMVSMQKNAIRLGAEGCPGVEELMIHLKNAWMGRPEDQHSTPKDVWGYKFEEALESGIRKYGEPDPVLEALPEYNLELLTGRFATGLLVGQPGDNYHFAKVLNRLVAEPFSDEERASILWNAATTKDKAREWGIDFVYHRIKEAKVAPEPERENPKLEEKIAMSGNHDGALSLLTDEEREYIAKRPTFIQHYMATAKDAGIDNETYTFAGAWSVLSKAFAFKGFIPQSATSKLGTNLWMVTPGPSGSGKTSAFNFEVAVEDVLFKKDNPDGAPYRTGADNSPQGLHLHLLERDRKPTVLSQDEASVFFKAVLTKNWMEEMTHNMSDWYMGYVNASSKISLKDFRGKTALTSFHMAMYATPDMLFSLISDDLFLTGFGPRILWTIAPDLTDAEEDRKYLKRQYMGGVEGEPDADSQQAIDLATNLVSAARQVGSKPRPILSDPPELHRMYLAHKAMGEFIKRHPKQAVLEPSVTRLGEDALRKCAMLLAMYRGDTRIRKDDTLHAIAAVEVWFDNLLKVVDLIAQGAFQKLCNDIEDFVMKGGTVNETKITHAFTNRIQRDPRELDQAINHLVRAGRLIRVDEDGKVAKYKINGASAN